MGFASTVINIHKEAGSGELPGQGGMECLINQDEQGGGEGAALLDSLP